MAAENMDDEIEIKLNDIEKLKLIEFYKENEILWNNDDPNRNNEIKKNAVKEKMFKSFDGGKFAILSLEKIFHSLRTSFTREFKKIKAGIEQKKKWTFYDAMLFLSSKTTDKKVEFNLKEKEILISFYANNPALWDHKHRDYRDRNLRKALYEKLLIEFVEGKFNEDDIRKEWHNLLT